MRALLVALVAASLLVACDKPPLPTVDSVPSVTLTSPTRTSTPTGSLPSVPAPPDPGLPTWDAPPKAGVPHVDAVIAAVLARDEATLRQYITGVVLPCTAANDNDRRCLPNTTPGTPTRYIESYLCDGALLPLAEDNTPREATAQSFVEQIIERSRRLVIAWELQATNYRPQAGYLVAFGMDERFSPGRGIEVRLDDHGIVAVGMAAGCNTSAGFLGSHRYDKVLIPLASER